MSALLGAKKSYKVLKKQFPAVELHEDDIRRELVKNGFREVRMVTMRTEDFKITIKDSLSSLEKNIRTERNFACYL